MGERLNILCVDDDADALFIASLSLRLDPDIEVFGALSGPEALKALEAQSPKITCILTDSRMSQMSGAELTSTVRSRPHLAAIPVIFLTASADLAEARAFKALGALGVIAKPYDPLNLADQVKTLLRGD